MASDGREENDDNDVVKWWVVGRGGNGWNSGRVSGGMPRLPCASNVDTIRLVLPAFFASSSCRLFCIIIHVF